MSGYQSGRRVSRLPRAESASNYCNYFDATGCDRPVRNSLLCPRLPRLHRYR